MSNRASNGEEIAWARFDCRDGAMVDFEQAKAICVPRANAAGVAGTASMPVGRGIGGAIGSGIMAGITQAQITNDVVVSCMAERGFTRRTRPEHFAACPKSKGLIANPAPA